MFAGWKVAAATGLVGIVACAILFGLWKSSQADVEKANQKIVQFQATIALAETQRDEFKKQVAERDALIASHESQQKEDAKLITDLQLGQSDTIKKYLQARKELNNATEATDGPVAFILNTATDQLRELCVRVESLRASNQRADSQGAPANPAGTQDDPCAAAVVTPTKQSEFATLSLRFATAYELSAKVISKLQPFEDSYNAEVDRFNARP